MAAFHTLALALVPTFIQRRVRHNENRVAETAALRIAEARPAHAPRHRALSCHWERAEDGSLVAHWVSDGEDPSHGSPQGRSCSLLRDIPRNLIDAAYHFERHGSVFALIAMSRMARINQSKHAWHPNMEAGPPE